MSLQNVTVEYCELLGSEVRDLAAFEASEIERKFLINWDDAPQFCDEVLGGIRAVGQTQEWIQPNVHPIYTQLWVMRVRIEGLGQCTKDNLGIISYTKAIATLKYGAKSEGAGDSKSVVYITETRTYSYEYFSVKENASFFFMKFPLKFVDLIKFNGIVPYRGGIYDPGPGGRKIRGRRTRVPAHVFSVDDVDTKDPAPGTAVKIIKPMAEITIVIHWWFDYPDDDFGIMGLVGCVNADWYKPLLSEYPPHTLLLSGVNRTRQFTTRTDPTRTNPSDNLSSVAREAWQIEFKFLLNVYGWNSVYRGKTRKVDPGVPGKLPVNRTWGAGWYIVAKDDGNGNLLFPFTPAPFGEFLLPGGITPRN